MACVIALWPKEHWCLLRFVLTRNGRYCSGRLHVLSTTFIQSCSSHIYHLLLFKISRFYLPFCSTCPAMQLGMYPDMNFTVKARSVKKGFSPFLKIWWVVVGYSILVCWTSTLVILSVWLLRQVQKASEEHNIEVKTCVDKIPTCSRDIPAPQVCLWINLVSNCLL